MRKTAGAVLGMALLLTMWVSSVYGQSNALRGEGEYYEQSGRLNVWTTAAVVRRRYGNAPELLAARFGSHEGFDRVVFELKGDLIGYLINYGEPPFQAEDGDAVIKVRGKAFVEIELYPVKSSDERIRAYEKMLAGQNKVKRALIREVKAVEWFEGELRCVVGLNREAPFRVQVLSNPTRLVIDFKH